MNCLYSVLIYQYRLTLYRVIIHLGKDTFSCRVMPLVTAQVARSFLCSLFTMHRCTCYNLQNRSDTNDYYFW